MKLSNNGLEVIKQFEGCRLKAYKCPAGVLTIGYGHTGEGIFPGDIITQKGAEKLLRSDVKSFEEGVDDIASNATLVLTQGQFDALVSFSFNVGLYALKRSTLLHRLREGDTVGAANEFARWNKAGGKVLLGLVARRNAEKKLFVS